LAEVEQRAIFGFILVYKLVEPSCVAQVIRARVGIVWVSVKVNVQLNAHKAVLADTVKKGGLGGIHVLSSFHSTSSGNMVPCSKASHGQKPSVYSCIGKLMRARLDSPGVSKTPQISLVQTVPAAITPPAHSAVSDAAVLMLAEAQPAHWLHNTVVSSLIGFRGAARPFVIEYAYL
jgi:hypothetical protein